ncbi:MAG: ribonucleoside-diphosphate reductase subunit alpha, partial [Candidatus Dormiibacterota bacterium]
QSQSHNVFLRGATGRVLDETYRAAWRMGLKTTYYLRSLAASQIEKSTLDAGRYGFTQERDYAAVDAPKVTVAAPAPQPTAAVPAGTPVAQAAGVAQPAPAGLSRPLAVPSAVPDGESKLCRIDDPDCEACQ